MGRIAKSNGVVGLVLVILLGVAGAARGQEKAVTASDGWVKLPAAGESTAMAFAVVNNPTMYDIYLVSAAADAAGKVEFRRTQGSEAQPVKEVTVQAYGSLYMEPTGVYLLLSELKQPLQESQTVALTLRTDGGETLRVSAPVRKE